MKGFLALGPVKFIVELVDLYFGKRVPQSAAALAYYLILTFFPVLICVNAFVGLLNLDVNMVVLAAERFLPTESLGILGDYLSYITENQSPGLLTAGLGVTIFSAVSAFRTLMNTMDELYDRTSYQGLWRIVVSFLFSVLLLAIIYLSIAVVLTGEWLFRLAAQYLNLDAAALPWDWQWLRFPLLFALVLFFVLVVYRMAAPRGKPRPPHLHRRGAGLRRPGGGLYDLFLVYRDVLPVLSGVRVPGLGHHSAGLALPLREHPYAGQCV